MKLNNRINDWNLKGKISFFLTLTILVTSIIIMAISTVSSMNYMTKQSREMAETQLDTLASNYADTLKQYQELAVALVIEDSVQKNCRSADDTGAEYDAGASRVYNYLLNMINVRSNMNFVVVGKEHGKRYVYKGNSSIVDARFDSAYPEDYEESIPAKPGNAVRMSFGNHYFKDGKYTLTLYHPVYSTSSINDIKGMLVLNLNDSLVDKLYGNGTQSLNSELLLVDCEGKIVSVSDRERIGKLTSYMREIKGSKGSFRKAGVLINYQRVGDWNYYLVNEIPVFELYRGSIGAVCMMLLVIFGMTMCSIVVLRRMMTAFYEPVNRVVMAMDDVADGKIEKRIAVENMDVDSRKIAEGFNSMMNRIDLLLEQVKLEQHQMEQIRFHALQSQIKPHFLYNTLDCIHWQAVSDGNKEISVMVKAMAQYYRICLSKGKEIIPLKLEMEHIRSYLIIQNMRYDNIVELEDHITEEYYDIMIPKMTLQPLIENAIYHGIQSKEGGKGRILLSIRREGQNVCLSVCDSGTGMSHEKIEEMNRSVRHYDESFGYGVRNVNRRIELIFGKEYGLRFSGNEHGGVTVEILLPSEGKSGDSEVI